MGSRQSSTASWSVDDWAFGTGQNALSLDEVVEESKQIPIKYFGGSAVENDPSMHQMQNDLLNFDDSLKNLFRRKKNRRARRDQQQQPSGEEYYYYEEGEQQQQQQYEQYPQSKDAQQNQTYLSPIYVQSNDQTLSGTGNKNYDPSETEEKAAAKAIWRCSNCTVENKITERVCRRCGQAETKF